MRELKNIDWNYNGELPSVDEMYDEPVCEIDEHWVKFDYNGYKVEAVTSFCLTLETDTHEGGSDDRGNTETWREVSVNEIEFGLVRMYYNDGEDFTVVAKEFHNIQEQLRIDLNTKY